MIDNLQKVQITSGGEGGIRTLAALRTLYSLSRGAPSAVLGYFSFYKMRGRLAQSYARAMVLAEKVGFEPTVPFGITGFQDQLLKPLGHLSALGQRTVALL